MLLIAIFVELRVIAGRSRKLAGSPQAISGRPLLCRGLEKNGVVRARHGHGMASVNQTRQHCVNQMGKTHFKPLAAWHGRGMLYVNRPLSASLYLSYQFCQRSTKPVLSNPSFICRECTYNLTQFLFRH
jgi:hypothetical protein